jgi:hypothetical protein
MKRMAVVHDSELVNVILVPEEWTGDGEDEWSPPEGCEVRPATEADRLEGEALEPDPVAEEIVAVLEQLSGPPAEGVAAAPMKDPPPALVSKALRLLLEAERDRRTGRP